MPQKIPIPAGATEVIIPDPVTTQALPTFTIPEQPPVNKPPVASISGNIRVMADATGKGKTTLTAQASDPEGKPVTILWSGHSGIKSPTALVTEVTDLPVGNTGIKLSVYDPELMETSASVVVVVTAQSSTRQPELHAKFTKVTSINRGTPIPNEIGPSWSTLQFARNDQVTIETNIIRHPGHKSVRFRTKSTDTVVSGNIRSEITLPSKEKEGDIVGYGWSAYWVNNPVDDQPKSFFQVHDQEPSAGSPGFMLYVRRLIAEMVLTQGKTAAAGTYEKGKNSINNNWYPQLTYGKELPLQKWVDFVVIRKMSSTGNGFIKIYVDGQLVVSRMPGDAGFNGITTYQPPNTEYLKWGNYCHKWAGGNFACEVPDRKRPDGQINDCKMVDMIGGNFRRYFATESDTIQDIFNVVNPASP